MIVIERELDRISGEIVIQDPCPFFPVTSFIIPIDTFEPSIWEAFF